MKKVLADTGLWGASSVSTQAKTVWWDQPSSRPWPGNIYALLLNCVYWNAMLLNHLFQKQAPLWPMEHRLFNFAIVLPLTLFDPYKELFFFKSFSRNPKCLFPSFQPSRLSLFPIAPLCRFPLFCNPPSHISVFVLSWFFTWFIGLFLLSCTQVSFWIFGEEK